MTSFGRRTRMCTAALAAVLLSSPAVLPAQRAEDEERVKAAFLYNFTRFVEWPETAFKGPDAPFVVCAFATPGFRAKLEAILKDEQVRGRAIRVAPGDVEDARTCHLLYFAKEQTVRQERVVPGLRKIPVLSVGEGRRFLELGGLVAFLLEDDRVRFAISKPRLDEAGLSVSSQLLRVARSPAEEPVP